MYNKEMLESMEKVAANREANAVLEKAKELIAQK